MKGLLQRLGWKKADAQLITTARLSPAQDRHRRTVIYGWLMFLRVPSLIIAVYLIAVHEAWYAAAAVVLVTFPVPWLAVVAANAQGEKKDRRERAMYKPGIARQLQQTQQLQQHSRQRLDSQPRLTELDAPPQPIIIDYREDDRD